MAAGGLKMNVWDRDGEPWFMMSQVLKALDLKVSSLVHNLKNIDDSEKVKERIKHLTKDQTLLSGPFKMSAHIDKWFISESGLYKLIMRSNKPEAKTFQDWVTKIVIPSIRKDGGYIMGEEKVTLPEDLMTILNTF